MFYIQQTSNHDCGFTCLKMMLANINKDESYLFLTNPFNEKENISFFDLVDYAEQFGLTLVASKALEKRDIFKIDKLPIIARLNIDNLYHAVYVYKVSKKKVYFYDPHYGKKSLSIEEFINYWDTNFLRIDNYIKMRCPERPPVLISKTERVISLLFSFISGISCVFGIYFINKNSPYYLPALFLMNMILFELINRKFALFISKKADIRILDYYDDIKQHDYHLFSELYEKYKLHLSIDDMNLFTNAFAIIMIVVILLVNAKSNLIYIGVSFLLALVSSYIIKPLFKKSEKSIEEMENRLKNINLVDIANEKMTEIRKKSYSYADNYLFFRYLFIAIQLAVAFMVMKLSGVFSLTYIICYLFLEIYLYQNFNGLFSYRDEKQKANNALVKLLSILQKNSQ